MEAPWAVADIPPAHFFAKQSGEINPKSTGNDGVYGLSVGADWYSSLMRLLAVIALVAGVVLIVSGSWWWGIGAVVAGLIFNGVAREQVAKRRAARAAGVEPSRPFLEFFGGWGDR